jgi:hypothetical protein
LYTFIGVVFVWIWFPVFVIDPVYKGDLIGEGLFMERMGYCCWGILLAMSGSVTVTLGLSLIFYGKLRVMDLLYAPIVGAISVGSITPYNQ